MSLLLRVQNRDVRRNHRGRIVPELKVESFPFGLRNGESGCHKTVGHGYRVAEVGIAADGVDEKELVSVERSLFLRGSFAPNAFENRHSDQGNQRLPIPINSTFGNRTKLQGAECRGSQQLHRIERGKYGL